MDRVNTSTYSIEGSLLGSRDISKTHRDRKIRLIIM